MAKKVIESGNLECTEHKTSGVAGTSDTLQLRTKKILGQIRD
jgi:hypothetical protein